MLDNWTLSKAGNDSSGVYVGHQERGDGVEGAAGVGGAAGVEGAAGGGGVTVSHTEYHVIFPFCLTDCVYIALLLEPDRSRIANVANLNIDVNVSSGQCRWLANSRRLRQCQFIAQHNEGILRHPVDFTGLTYVQGRGGGHIILLGQHGWVHRRVEVGQLNILHFKTEREASFGPAGAKQWTIAWFGSRQLSLAKARLWQCQTLTNTSKLVDQLVLLRWTRGLNQRSLIFQLLPDYELFYLKPLSVAIGAWRSVLRPQ